MADGFGLWSKWGRWSLSMSDFINKYCVYENWGFMVDGFGVNGVDSRLLMSDFINSSESENWGFMADGFGLWSKWGRWPLSMSDFFNKVVCLFTLMPWVNLCKKLQNCHRSFEQ